MVQVEEFEALPPPTSEFFNEDPPIKAGAVRPHTTDVHYTEQPKACFAYRTTHIPLDPGIRPYFLAGYRG